MRLKDPFLILSIVTMFLLATVLAISLTENVRSGSLKISVTGTRGVWLGHLVRGSVVTGSYQADSALKVYLLTDQEAEEWRDPSYYHEIELPEPMATGRNGSFKIRIDESGSYEVLFWNESFNKNHDVSYRIGTGKRIREAPFITSMLSLTLITTVLAVIAYMRDRRKGHPLDHIVRR